MDVQQRVERLERTNRRLRLGLVALAVSFGLVICRWYDHAVSAGATSGPSSTQGYIHAVIPDANLGCVLVRAEIATGRIAYKPDAKAIHEALDGAVRDQQNPKSPLHKGSEERVARRKRLIDKDWLSFDEFEDVGGGYPEPDVGSIRSELLDVQLDVAAIRRALEK